ncbi:MAG: ATP-binding cassette domain-containing protein, partial [Gaiellaceae bacterium]
AGERQRVALARALANRPRLVLADEPTANLDSSAGRDVMRLLRELTQRKGHAAVIVSHDPRLRRIADRVLRLEDGRLRQGGHRGNALHAHDLAGASESRGRVRPPLERMGRVEPS